MIKLMETIEKVVDGHVIKINAYQDECEPPDFDDFDKSDFFRAAYESGELMHTIIEVTVSDKSGVIEGENTCGGYLLWASDLETLVEERVSIEGMALGAIEDLETKIAKVLEHA
jgi:hypothetical protein